MTANALLEEFLLGLCANIEPMERDWPTTFVHYTSMAGFYGITSSNSVWLSHYSSLNDPTDVMYAQQLAFEYVKKYIGKRNDIIRSQFSIDIERTIDEHMTYAFAENIYVLSFCASDETSRTFKEGKTIDHLHGDLSMWRMYGAEGTGVCIGLNADWFKKIRKDEKIKRKLDLYFFKCRYESDEDFTRTINGICSLFFDAVDGRVDYGFSAQQMTECFHWAVLVAATTRKNPAYQHEREWRLLYFGNPTIDEPLYRSEHPDNIDEDIELPKMRLIATLQNEQLNSKLEYPLDRMNAILGAPVIQKNPIKLKQSFWDYFLDYVILGPGVKNRQSANLAVATQLQGLRFVQPNYVISQSNLPYVLRR